jgi:hypothetical protein
MPLTKAEREFLPAYVYEATQEPFGGPATSDLQSRGIHYSDLNWILTAYDRELCAQGVPPLGHQNPNPPPSPWTELAQSKLRNQELQEEWESEVARPGNGEPAMPIPRGPSQDSTMATSKH